MNYLERIYDAVVASDVSTAFAVVIAVIFGLSLLARFPAFARPFGALLWAIGWAARKLGIRPLM